MKNIIKAINQCVTLYSQRQYQEVVNKLPPLLNHIPFNGQLIYILAMSERFVGNIEQSKYYFNMLLENESNNCAYLCGYANFLITLHEVDKAQYLFEKSLSINRHYFDANYNLARLFTLQQNFVQAYKYYQASVLIEPHNQSAYLGLIDCESKVENQEQAIKTCLSFIQNNTENKQIKHKLALLYKNSENITQCIATYQELLHSFPDDYSINKSYLLSCAYLGFLDTLEEDLEKILMINPNDYEIHECYFNLLWNQKRAGYFTSYKKYYDVITNVDVLYSFCKKLIKEDLLLESLKVIERAFILNIKLENAYLIKGHVLRELGDFEQALLLLQKGEALFPEHIDLSYELVVTYLCLKQYEKALQLSKKMTEISPKHQGCWALYATTLRYSGYEKEYNKLYDYQKFVKVYSVPHPERYNNVVKYNSELFDELEKHQKNKQYPIEQSVRNGRQTPSHLFSNTSVFIQEFKLALGKVVDKYIGQLKKTEGHPLLMHTDNNYFFSGAWSIHMQNKGYHKNHYHHKGWISGPYYVVVPDAVNSKGEGWLKLGQAELSRWLTQEADYYIKPCVGEVILFPSYMWHGTVPLTKKESRVTIGFDVTPQ